MKGERKKHRLLRLAAERLMEVMKAAQEARSYGEPEILQALADEQERLMEDVLLQVKQYNN